MKKAVAFLMGSVALLTSQTAMAHKSYIEGPAPWVFEGSVDVNKGIALTCDVEVTLRDPLHATDAADSNPQFDHTDIDHLTADIVLSGGFLGLCSSVVVSQVAQGDVLYSGGTFELRNVNVTTITPGNCAGSIFGTWNEGTQRLSVSGTLPAVSGADCTMDGELDLISPASGNVVGAGDSDHRSYHHNVI